MTEHIKEETGVTETPVAAKPLEGKGAEEINKLHVNIERPNIVSREMTFSFRKTKNELGEEIKRPTIKLDLPVLTIDGLVDSLSSDIKVQNFVLDLIADAVKSAAKDQVDDENNPVNTQEELDLTKLQIGYLASQPKAERTGGGISKEVWEAWAADYIDVMVSATNAKEDHVKNAVGIFVKRYAPVKSHKPVLTKLRERLAIYATNTKNLEEFAEVVEYLDKRAETLLKADPAADLLENI